jgi:GNAT superfamily N-acetyltransferase
MIKPKTKSTVAYSRGGVEHLYFVKPLWTELNRLHARTSSYFSEFFENWSFEKRRKMLVEKLPEGDLMVDMVKHRETGDLIAYCICTIDERKIGEIDSIFVEKPYRGMAIGDALMKRALEWLDIKGAVSRKISVAVGNEAALPFYKRYGFFPRLLVLQEK